MENNDRRFNGYEVPEALRTISAAICTRFAIIGECDPMYSANVIAVENGCGTGSGNFSNYEITNAASTAKRLQGCYGCNITRNEIDELKTIIETGHMDAETSKAGLIAFKKRNNTEMKTCDAWRVDYLKRVNAQIDETLKSIA